jgi:HIV Tat-specific factor 1
LVINSSSKLADWDDDDPATFQAPTKWDKVVILKHMFTLDELEDDPAALLDIKEDVREECSKFGEVTNVTLFDKEKDGVMSIRFKTLEAAAACIMVSCFLIVNYFN